MLFTHTVFGEPPVGKLSKVERERPGWDVAGVETGGATTFVLESVGAGGDPAGLEGYLKAMNVHGEVRTITDLASFERSNNPDGKQEYGFGPGVTGAVSTLAVLPPRLAIIPAGLHIPVDMMGTTVEVPECTGYEYAFEAVPTDVELGPDPWTGVTHPWAEDILSPTGLAVSNTGDVYVASMFGNEILKIDAWTGKRSVFLEATTPGAVEIHGRTLYATVDALPDFTASPPPPPAGKVIKADIR